MTTEPTTENPDKPERYVLDLDKEYPQYLWEKEQTRVSDAYTSALFYPEPPYHKEYVGDVRVDSGMMIVGDPRHLIGFPAGEAGNVGELSYEGARCSATENGVFNSTVHLGRIEGPDRYVPTGHAVAVPTNMGDGHYPVFATVNLVTGKVVAIEVRFDHADEIRFFARNRDSRRHASTRYEF